MQTIVGGRHLRSRMAVAVCAALMALTPAAALAHGSAQLAPGDLPSQWTLEAQIVIPLCAISWLYFSGVRSIWRRAGVGHGVRVWEAGAFALAMFTLVIALVSPLDAAADAVFTAHMVQHTMLMLVVAPLLALSAPGVVFAWALPSGAHPVLHRAQHAPAMRRLSALVLHPVFVWTQFAVIFWAWHVPMLYDAAIRHDTLHGIEHLSLLGSSVLFWWLVLRYSGRRRFPYPAAIVFVFTTMLQMMIVPVLLTFSGALWYPHYAAINPAWHLRPTGDQQLGGLVMWMTSNVIFILLGLYLVARWLIDEERRAESSAARAGAAPARRSWMTL